MKLKCFKCNKVLSESEYIESDKKGVENEISLRKIVREVYNKRRNDREFPSGPEGDELYDNYLENIESKITILSNPDPRTNEEKAKVRKEIQDFRKNPQNSQNIQNGKTENEE